MAIAHFVKKFAISSNSKKTHLKPNDVKILPSKKMIVIFYPNFLLALS